MAAASAESFIHDINSFKWSENEYSPAELLDEFEHTLPMLIMVTQGFMGADEDISNVDCEQMYWFYDVVTQLRLVVKDEKRIHYSFPITYPVSVTPSLSNGKDGPEMSIKDLSSHTEYRFLQFPAGTTHRICIDGDVSQTQTFGILEIVETYRERFLAVHAVLTEECEHPTKKTRDGWPILIKGGLYPVPNVLPGYIPVALAIAVTDSNSDSDRFLKVLRKFKRYADKQEHSYDRLLKESSDIMMFDQMPQTGNYDYLHFLQFMKANKAAQNISSDGYWQISDVQAVLPKRLAKVDVPAPPIPTREKTVKCPPKKSQSVVQRLFKKKEKTTTLKKKPPPPPPSIREHLSESEDTQSSESDSYELSEDETYNTVGPTYLNMKPTKLSERVGPVALGVDIYEALSKIHFELKQTDMDDDAQELEVVASRMHSNNVGSSQGRLNSTKSSNFRNAATHEPQHIKPKTTQLMRRPVPKPSDATTQNPHQYVPWNAHENLLPSSEAILKAKQNLKAKHVAQKPLKAGNDTQQKVLGAAMMNVKCMDSKSPLSKAPPTTSKPNKQVIKKAVKASENNTKGLFHKLNDVPSDISGLTVQQIGRCLELLGLGEYTETFSENQIDGDFLKSLEEDIICENFNIKRTAALKLMMFVRGLR